VCIYTEVQGVGLWVWYVDSIGSAGGARRIFMAVVEVEASFNDPTPAGHR
jgi:hypothetical protein